MDNEADDYLKRFEALHVAHFGDQAKFIAGEKALAKK